MSRRGENEIKVKPRLAWPVMVLFVLALGYAVYAALPKLTGEFSPYAIGGAMGRIAAIVIWPLVLGFVAFLIAQRSQRAFNITAGVILVLLTVMGVRADLTRKSVDNGHDLTDEAAASVDQTEPQAASMSDPDGVSDTNRRERTAPASQSPEALAKEQDALNAAFNNAVRVVMQDAAVTQERLMKNEENLKRLEQRLNSSQADHELRADIIQKYDAHLALFSQHQRQLRGFHAAVEEKLKRAPGSQHDKQALISGVLHGGDAGLRAAMDVDTAAIRVFELTKERHELLLRNKDKWSVDRGRNGIVFSREMPAIVANRLNELNKEIQKAGDDLNRASQQQVDRSNQPGGG